MSPESLALGTKAPPAEHAAADPAPGLGERRPEVVCVDLDGTLIAADLFFESALRLILQRPWLLFVLPIWALRGKAHLKRQIAVRVDLRADQLPYRAEILEQLRAAHARGAHLVLATGSDERYARQVCDHLGFFSHVMASDGQSNLTGRRKAQRLVEAFGHGQFHYFGNDWSDVSVWRVAASATVVAGPPRLVRYVRARMNMRESLSDRPGRVKAMLRAMRPHQWAKNLLIFVPLVTSHQLWNLDKLTTALIAFLAFGLCASAIYIVNDLLDIQSDRAHPRKRFRPFAAGDLSVPTGVAMAGGLLVLAAVAAAATGSASYAVVLGIYLITTTAYSVRLKREPVLDVFVLASLYVVRVIGGAVATDVALSNWLLGFGLFIFLSLAFVKRYTELVGQNGNMPGRGYTAADHAWMISIGICAGYMAVVILALYVDSNDVAALYTRPRALWLLCPVILFWITRMWFRAGRQQVHDDPVVEALRDPISYVCALTIGLALMAAV
jgi:4-hydroxybenzoate polyprenyltransferase/phosphoserine phosphatase